MNWFWQLPLAATSGTRGIGCGTRKHEARRSSSSTSSANIYDLSDRIQLLAPVPRLTNSCTTDKE